MSPSDPNSKIDFLDSPEVMKEKINAAYCQEGNVKVNGLLAFTNAGDSHLQDVLVNPFISIDVPEGTIFIIDRAEKSGGPIHYQSYREMEDDFALKKIYPKHLKNGIEAAVITLSGPIRKSFEKNDKWREVEKHAYLDLVTKNKPERRKKVRFPG
ncbi:hypothetical protein PQX77_016700 [Marasmius sp. AFHP31]|nr:hypothetical protein PQX77_016700 [Marasmius sp. AFHP31]